MGTRVHNPRRGGLSNEVAAVFDQGETLFCTGITLLPALRLGIINGSLSLSGCCGGGIWYAL